MAFKRDIEERLTAWKNSDGRKPLIIRGARQVGKTTLVKDFASVYKHTIFLNLEKPADRRFFEDFNDVHTIMESLLLATESQGSKSTHKGLCSIGKTGHVRGPESKEVIHGFYGNQPTA